MFRVSIASALKSHTHFKFSSASHHLSLLHRLLTKQSNVYSQLLLHHVVPGAFKAADLKAGDEMTGVSLAGTQLRANLYARQLFDNRWNDIEVIIVRTSSKAGR